MSADEQAWVGAAKTCVGRDSCRGCPQPEWCIGPIPARVIFALATKVAAGDELYDAQQQFRGCTSPRITAALTHYEEATR